MRQTTLTKKLFYIILIFQTGFSLAGVPNLSKWTLQDPVNGSSKVRSKELVANKYRNSWFKRNSNSFTMTAPKNGKTSGSSSVRTELVQEPGNSNNVSSNKDRGETWRPKDKSSNKLTVKVRLQNALDGRVYLNQIHTKNSGKRPLLMALWDEKKSKITLEVKQKNSKNSKIARYDIKDVRKNKIYEIKTGIDKKGGNHSLFYYVKLGGTTIAKYRAYFDRKLPNSKETLANSWLDDNCYFKTGVYNKTKRSSSSPGGSYSRIELYSVEATYK